MIRRPSWNRVALVGPLLWLGVGCLQPVCEAPGSCPHPATIVDAGTAANAGRDAGVDAGAEGAGDAGADGGPEAGVEVPCTETSDCPSGTECDFRCGDDPTANQPYVRYNRAAGVCRPNPLNCTSQPEVCNDPTAGYCDFEGRCVKMAGLCQKPIGCPSDCSQTGPCGCICSTCPKTANGGR